MKRILLVLVIVLLALGAYWYFSNGKKQEDKEPKAAALATKRHSDGFNSGIDSLMDKYLELKNAFVDADTAKAKSAAGQLVSLTDSSRLMELKKDASGIFESAAMQLNDVKLNAESLLNQTDLT